MSTNWSIWIGDSYCVYEYEIEGDSNRSISFVATAIESALNGKIIQSKLVASVTKEMAND